MSRKCNLAAPEEALQVSAGQLLTRERFDSHMQSVAFRSREDLEAALAGKPAQHGHVGKRSAGGVAVRLDPTRICGWTATLLINICIWGLAFYVSTRSTTLGIALAVASGLALWHLVETCLIPKLAGVLWPLIPTAASAAGLLLVKLLVLELKLIDENLVVGAYVVALLLYVTVFGDSGASWSISCELLLVGAVATVAALRLFINPGVWGSVEIVSWALNVGALALCLGAHLLLELPFAAGSWRCLFYLPAMLGVSFLGAVSDRERTRLLAALSLTQVSGRAAWEVSLLAPDGFAQVACFASFGAIGVVVICVGQWLQNSAWRLKVTMEARYALAWVLCSQDLPTLLESEGAGFIH